MPDEGSPSVPTAQAVELLQQRTPAPLHLVQQLARQRRWSSMSLDARPRQAPAVRCSSSWLNCPITSSLLAIDCSILMRFDATAVVGQAVERYHHVLVDLEGVGVCRDRRSARAVQPEALARLGADRE